MLRFRDQAVSCQALSKVLTPKFLGDIGHGSSCVALTRKSDTLMGLSFGSAKERLQVIEKPSSATRCSRSTTTDGYGGPGIRDLSMPQTHKPTVSVSLSGVFALPPSLLDWV